MIASSLAKLKKMVSRVAEDLRGHKLTRWVKVDDLGEWVILARCRVCGTTVAIYLHEFKYRASGAALEDDCRWK